MGTASAWTPDRRAKQVERIRHVKPWLSSTGPRTDDGKAISSRNAFRYSFRSIERPMQRHAMIGAKIVKIEMRLKGFKPLAPNRISSRACKLRTVTILKLKKELASLYVELNQLHRSNMADFTYAVDWDDLQFPFEMIEESIKSEP